MRKKMHAGIGSIFKRTRLKNRIIAALYISTITISVAFAIYYASVNKKQAVKEAGTQGVVISEQVLGACSFLMENIESASNSFFLDNDVQTLLQESQGIRNANAIPLHSSTLDLSVEISNKSCITSFAIYNDVGTLIYSISTDNSNIAKSADTEEETLLLARAKQLNGRQLWFAADQGRTPFLSKNTSEKIASCRAIKDRNFKGVAGYVILMVNKTRIRDICINCQLSPSDVIAIRGKGDLVLFCNSAGRTAELLPAASSQTAGASYYSVNLKKNYICAYSSNAKKDIAVSYLFSTRDIQKRIYSFQLFAFAFAIILLLLFLPVFLGVSTYLMRPINQLLEGMREVQRGNFKTQVVLDERSEINILAKGFNDMVANIDDLINENYLLQIKEKDAEMKSLQICMNPHFIYNTLDIIYWQAENGDQHELAETVLNLSRLLRLSLNYGHIFTTVKNEIELISKYLALQKLRFGDALQYEIAADPSVLDCPVPQYMLEPFVENAVIHGLYAKGGNLAVNVEKNGQNIVVGIVDDGIGMRPETLCELRAGSNKRSSDSSYAICNIVERLKLLYGNGYTFRIDSAEGKGTSVYLCIPIDSKYAKEDIL